MISFFGFLMCFIKAILRAFISKRIGLIGQPMNYDIHKIEKCNFKQLFILYQKGYQLHFIDLWSAQNTQIELKSLKEV